jgi:translocation and assembly module TamB
MRRRGAKRLLIWIGALLSIAILLLLTLPIWFPWVLRPIAAQYGLAWRSYQRIGYARFALGEVTFTNQSIRVRAQRVELPVPTAWFISDHRPLAAVENWELVTQSKPPTTQQRKRSVHAVARQVQSIVAGVQHWIPAASLTNGAVIVEGERLTLQQAAWRDTNVTALVRHVRLTNSLVIRASTSAAGPWAISIEAGTIRASADVIPTSSNIAVKGTVTTGTNRIAFTADFAPDGVLPRTGSIDAPGFAIELPKLPARVAGSAIARWNDPMFEINLAGSLVPRETQLPPVQFALQARGTTNQAEVSRLEISGPGLTANLSRPLTVPFRGEQPSAMLSVEADLSRQPWTNLTGMIRGQITFLPATNRFPRTEFAVSGTNISAYRVRAKSLAATGLVVWPRIELQQANVEFGETGRATLSGHADLEQKTLGHVELNATGSAFERWIPTNVGVRLQSVHATAQGPFTNLIYVVEAAGKAATNRWLNETHVELKARGNSRTIGEASLNVQASDSIASMTFSAVIGDATNQVKVDQLNFRRGTTDVLRLEEPAILSIGGNATPFRMQTTPLRLRGNDRLLSVSANIEWPRRGVVACEIRNLQSQDFAAFLSTNLHALNIKTADAHVRWDDGPLLGHARLDGNYTIGEQFHASCEIAALESGVDITNLLVWSEAAPVIYARGILPVRVQPAGPTQFEAIPEREIDVLVGTERDPTFWERIGKLTDVKVVNPEIQGRISGPWNAPKGQINATIAKLEIARTNAAIPPITDVRLSAQLGRQLIQIPELHAKIEGQPLRFSGQLPLRNKARLKDIPDWTNGTGHLLIESAAIAPFARYRPELLAPVGELDAEITLGAGNITGHVTITNATTQPVGNFGALRDISARLDLNGRVVKLTEARARLAGEPVLASGFINFQSNSVRNLPPFQVNVVATNVVLVRNPETVIRSDLDIALINSSTSAPVVSGTVLLRDSFYLSDLESLVPGSVAQPERRPPYFSVEAEPLASWQLNLNVTGREFLKLRTPFLRGTVSTDFRLHGTLREPIASGEARMSSGVVEFPFGSLSVKQARSWLTPEQPFLPQIYLTASAKRYAYDVTLEVTGTADKPLIHFSSVPSLTSEKIFLMLTAGELPRDEITFSTEQKAQRFAVFVGSKLLNSLGFGGTSERLTIRSGEEISESGSQTYDVEYKLTDRWALVGEYDRFNDFNVSVKRRIFSR